MWRKGSSSSLNLHVVSETFIRSLTRFTARLLQCRLCDYRRWRPRQMYEILSKKDLAPKIKLFEVSAPPIAEKTRPGQFLVLIIDEKGERIPLTISDYDPKRGSVSFAFNEVGKTTKQLGLMKKGDSILNITGPLGVPSDIRKYGNVLCI